MQRFPSANARLTHAWMVLMAMLAFVPLHLFKIQGGPSLLAAAAATPVFSHPGGYYENDLQLILTVHAAQATILYTLDGTMPTRNTGIVYTQPIQLSAATPAVTVIRARALQPEIGLGPITSASYVVGVPANLPLLSLIVEPDDFWGFERGIYINSGARGREWERPVHATYVDTDRRDGFQVEAGLRIHGGASRSAPKKSLRLYFRSEYGTARLTYPLFGEEDTSFKRLILHNGGQDMAAQGERNWTLLRNQLMTNLAAYTHVETPYSRPVLLFINGESLGIYYLRERIEASFLEERYGIEAADLFDTPESVGEASILAGDRRHWDHLLQFVSGHDLADPAHYATVQTQLDVANLVDYTILQLYAGNIDWPNGDVKQFRARVQGGRWRWLLWDNDHTFAYPLHTNGVDVNLTESALVLDRDPATSGRHTLLLHNLLANPDFFDYFLQRTADLLNFTLAPANVITEIESLAATVAPDIDYETGRWPAATSWGNGVQALRAFALARPDILREQLVTQFDLQGTVQLRLDAPANGGGTVAVNDILLPELPWQGIYFHGTKVALMAVPAPGYRFAGWEGVEADAALITTLDSDRSLTPRFVTASVSAVSPGDVTMAVHCADHAVSIDLHLNRPGGLDVRRWRLTDNDSRTATDEGSLILPDHAALASVAQGTVLQIVVPRITIGTVTPTSLDDLDDSDGRMVLHAGNNLLDTTTDPWFRLGADDHLILLAPGPTNNFADDEVVAGVAVKMDNGRQGSAATCSVKQVTAAQISSWLYNFTQLPLPGPAK